MKKLLIALVILVSAHTLLAGGEHSGQVTVAGVPVPGATVTAAAGDKKLVTITDDQGRFSLPDATEGKWSLRVEMLGFESLTQDITVTAEPQPSAWTLTLKPFEEITKGIPIPTAAPAAPPVVASTNGSSGRSASARNSTGAAQTPGRGGFQRAGVTATPPAGGRPAGLPDEPAPPAEQAQTANDGFLINGSVNNGAASPFAQAAAFGNNRRGRGSLYNYQISVVEGNSAFDAAPFAFAGQPVTKSNYNDFHLSGVFGGPLRFRHFMPNKGPNIFLAYNHGDDHNATTQPGLMPTALERMGDFSQSVNRLGQPVQIVDPTTGKPFAGNAIPGTRISQQAASLLAYYPLPNLSGGAGYNFQTPITNFTRTEQFSSRVTQPINNRNQLIGTLAYQHNTTDQTTLFGFNDTSQISGADGSLQWMHRVNQFLTLRSRFQYTELTTQAVPYFANRINVSGNAGISGNNQDPANWGPPTLGFSTIAGLNDGLPNFNRNRTIGGNVELGWSRGRHYFTIGSDVRRVMVDIQSQQNPRGSFSFIGSATGYDVADFLLGIPTTSTIAFGNADKFLRQWSNDGYIDDDWRVSPTLSMKIGARWEYDSPMSETLGRLANLVPAPGFTSVAQVLGEQLIQPDYRGIEPRIGVAWRPVPGSSLVVRLGYGIYRNQNIYQPIVLLLAQQPPLSTAYQLQNTTMASGLAFNAPQAPPDHPLNTFAVDPNLRVGAAQNWQALVQRDLPASLTVTATYLGTKGTDLLQEFVPNTYPSGASNPCVTCPSGYVFLASNGTSSRHAAQLQLRRRLRNGLLASAQYTLAKATDNATAFAGVSLAGSAIAQDWRNLDAETAPSNFDQRHQLQATVQFTTGMGLAGGTLLDGWKGKLYKGWTLTGQLTTGSGLPLTPVTIAPVGTTGVTGNVRPSLTGASVDAPAGYYLNPAAYTTPAPGQWGDVGRNSVTGPLQFTFNAGITRTFQVSERVSFDWRLDATNVLNRVTYTGVSAVLGGQSFGLPASTNTPRKIQSTMRLRF
jgi:hypothetical protein